jgi:hypothetical protein
MQQGNNSNGQPLTSSSDARALLERLILLQQQQQRLHQRPSTTMADQNARQNINPALLAQQSRPQMAPITSQSLTHQGLPMGRQNIAPQRPHLINTGLPGTPSPLMPLARPPQMTGMMAVPVSQQSPTTSNLTNMTKHQSSSSTSKKSRQSKSQRPTPPPGMSRFL